MEDIEADTQIATDNGVEYSKWYQLYLLINEWMEEDVEKPDAFDEGYATALSNVLEAINNLNEGKYPYDIH